MDAIAKARSNTLLTIGWVFQKPPANPVAHSDSFQQPHQCYVLSSNRSAIVSMLFYTANGVDY
jgi:hypothetical protein